MVDTTLPKSVRVFTQDTADGRGIYVQVLPNQTEPELASPFFNEAIPAFDYTVEL